MTDMDYKQKYKEALTWVESIYHELSHDRQMEAEAFFPELKESEDEKIRKEILSFCQGRADNYPNAPMYGNIRKWIAWLEKQGQKPYGQRTECLDCQFNYAGECKGSCTIKRSEQKPTDKVEPKFHEGDWVMDKQGIVHQIANVVENITNHTYGYDIVGGGYFNDNNEDVRLWTIRDAKDGDVLFAENFDNIGGCVFLFNGLDSLKFDAEGDRAIATGYCCTSITESGNTDFGIQGPDCIEIKRVHPATKSQRDLLFQKMHEAGYEWDAEKKELKLLITNGGDFLEAENCEQKPIDYNEELKKCRENPLYFIDKYVKLQPKQVWSEEDEKNWRRAIRATQEVYPEAADWLKFLKDKYIWKPSNEQMEVLLSEVNSWKKGCPKQIVLESLYNDLKKLK